MNDFAKEELQEIVDMINDIHKGSQGHGLSLYFELRDKIQSIIDNYQDEKEIFSCYTAFGIDDKFFCQNQSMNADDLMPAFYQLANQCSDIIKSSGIYALKLQLVKIK